MLPPGPPHAIPFNPTGFMCGDHQNTGVMVPCYSPGRWHLTFRGSSDQGMPVWATVEDSLEAAASKVGRYCEAPAGLPTGVVDGYYPCSEGQWVLIHVCSSVRGEGGQDAGGGAAQEGMGGVRLWGLAMRAAA